jgi:Trypsin
MIESKSFFKLFFLGFLFTGFGYAIATEEAQALFAGISPDSPAARINPNTDPTFNGVGVIGNNCTGTAITLRHILSAGHCGVASSFTLNNANGTQSIFNGVGQLHPNYTSALAASDLQIITLNTPLPSSTTTYGFYNRAYITPSNPLEPITNPLFVTMVGYGQSGNGDTGNVTSGFDSRVKRVGGQQIDETGGGTFYFDFDDPARTVQNNFLDNLSIGNTIETQYGVGDSGSPAFVLENGKYLLFGTASYTSGRKFGSFAGGTEVFYNQAWIQSIISPTSVPFEFSPFLSFSAITGFVVIRKIVKQKRFKRSRE